MSAGMLALIVRDAEGGYNVVDSRTGEALAWRSELPSANEVAAYLNVTYPAAPWPAHDSLVHEVVGYRIAGPVFSLRSEITRGELSDRCPTHVPTGLGWDHLRA